MMEPVWRSLDVEGLETWYQVAGKEGGAPLIFIHGLGIDSTFWRHQLAAFAPEYRVAALDLPGHGRSAKPHDRVYSMDFFARLTNDLFHLRLENGSENIYFVHCRRICRPEQYQQSPPAGKQFCRQQVKREKQ